MTEARRAEQLTRGRYATMPSTPASCLAGLLGVGRDAEGDGEGRADPPPG